MPRQPQRAATVVSPDIVRARWALMSLFGLLGIMMSSWLSRLPSIRHSLGLTESALGLVLLAGALGSLLMIMAAGILVTRFGGGLMMHGATIGFAVAMVLIALSVVVGSIPLLCVGIFLNGLCFALNNVPFNVETAAIERAMRRTVIPQFHAAFSIGALVGTLLGAWCSAANVPVAWQFLASAVILVVWRVLTVPMVVIATVRPAAGTLAMSDGAPRRSMGARLGSSLGAWRERRTLLLGLVVMSASMSEGSANDWLAISVVDDFGRTEALGAVVFGVFVGSMTVFRMAGNGLIDKCGRVATLRWSAASSIVGLAIFGVAPSFVLASIGVALWGFGAALAYPIVIAAVSDDPLKAAGRVSVVSAFASMASLAAPPLLGLVAQQISTRYALVLLIGGLVLAVFLAGQARDVPPEAAPAPLADPGAVRLMTPHADAPADTYADTRDELTTVLNVVGHTETQPDGAFPAPLADHRMKEDACL